MSVSVQLCKLVEVVGEDDCILEKERQRGKGMNSQAGSALFLVSAQRLC